MKIGKRSGQEWKQNVRDLLMNGRQQEELQAACSQRGWQVGSWPLREGRDDRILGTERIEFSKSGDTPGCIQLWGERTKMWIVERARVQEVKSLGGIYDLFHVRSWSLTAPRNHCRHGHGAGATLSLFLPDTWLEWQESQTVHIYDLYLLVPPEENRCSQRIKASEALFTKPKGELGTSVGGVKAWRDLGVGLGKGRERQGIYFSPRFRNYTESKSENAEPRGEDVLKSLKWDSNFWFPYKINSDERLSCFFYHRLLEFLY